MSEAKNQVDDLLAQELVLMEAYNALDDHDAVCHHYDQFIALFCLSETIEKHLRDP